MINAFGKNIELKIHVPSDEVLLLGHAEEAAGKLLQGTLILNLTEAIKVKSVSLSFVGKMKVSWAEGVGHHQNYHKQERNIISHVWEFVKPQLHSFNSNSSTNSNNDTRNAHKKVKVLSAGQHSWPFELLIPGNLPQTLESEVGSITYRLKATIERTAFVQNTIKKRSIRILRCIMPSQYDLVQSLEIHNTWAEKMVYDIAVPSKLYSFNDTIPISFRILPIASQLRVHAIMASIKEYCTYKANDHSKTDTRIVRLVRVDHPFSEAITTSPNTEGWSRVVDLNIPAKSPLVFSDADSDMIKIRHRLKFVISLVNADGHISELRCAVHVIIVENFAVTEALNCLPAYDEMWRSVPYEPHIVEQLRTRTSISEQGTNQPIIPTQPRMESRQPVSISGWSRVLSLSSNIQQQHSSPMTIPGSNTSSRNHSRRPSIDEIDDNGVDDPRVSSSNGIETHHAEPLWWNGIDLGKVPSYRSVSTLNNPFSTSLPPAYDSLTPPISNINYFPYRQ